MAGSVLGGLLGLASVALSIPAAAQQPTAAVVVSGVDDVASVREPLFGALRGRQYATVPPDSVDAAIAFALSGAAVTADNAGQLRGALDATVLYLVSVRPAEDGSLFFSVQRLDAAGARSAFGRSAPAALTSNVTQQLLTLEASAPAAAPAVAAPPPSPAPQPPPSTGPGVAPAGAAAQEASPVPAAATPEAAAQPAPAGGGDPEATDGTGIGTVIAAMGIAWAGTLLLGGVASFAMCASRVQCADLDGFVGFAPLAGPWLSFGLLDLGNDGGVAMVTIGAIQAALLVAIIVTIAAAPKPEPEPEESQVTILPFGSPDGAGLGMRVTF
jgi:hypothetical protein